MQNNEPDIFIYVMANEKIISMIHTIENTFEFFEDYKVKPDDEVRKVMKQLIEKMGNWIK